MGTSYNWHWYGYIKSKAEEMDLRNIEFYPNIPLKKLVSLIGDSKVFIHTMLHEDFGLTTCEAIAGGCIPCVIDSGGQKEIVPVKNLRFRSVKEAIKIIKHINNLSESELKGLRNKLFSHIQQFDEQHFKDIMLKVILHMQR